MLRYFYLLVIIYFINSSFCYDYFNDEVRQRTRENVNQGDNNSRRKARTLKRNVQMKRQQYPVGNSEPVAQFDVADFMQGYDSIVDSIPLSSDTRNFRRPISKDYMSYDSFDSLFNIDTNEKRNEGWANAMDDEQNNVPEAPSTPKPMMMTDQPNEKNVDYSYTVTDDAAKENLDRLNYLSKSLYDPTIVARSPTVHHHQKKGVLKSIRFPFFSRNKAKTLAPTKDRKRMTAKSPKPERSKSLVNLNDQMVNDRRNYLYVMGSLSELINKKENKRSYFEKVCPACKKKYVPNQKAVPRSEPVPEKMIHNSRQFFQNQVVDRNPSKEKKNIVARSETGRERRQYMEEKERQMKELEEVAKKVESVDVNFSVSPSVPTALLFTPEV